MDRNQKNLAIGIGAFLLVFVVSVVYAATTGSLAFNGTANFQPNIELDIINAAITDGAKTGESVAIANDAKDLNFTLLFDTPNETRTVTFQIVNVGNKDTVLGTLSTTSPSATGLTINWPTLENVTLTPGQTSTTYSVVVQWTSEFTNDDAITFGATINYMEAS